MSSNPSEKDNTNPYGVQVHQTGRNPDFPTGSPRDTSNEGDATGGIIPYKNPKALIAYYLGIISGLPVIGLPFGIAAFTLGIMGLRDRKRKPIIKGAIHAWIGIGCGGFFAVFWAIMVIGVIVVSIVK